MEFIIISGMSGAGKSSAAAFLEDLGFYCVDNMPVALITSFAGLCMAGAGTGKYSRVALVTDIRGGQTFDELFQALDGLREMHLDYQLLFIEAADEDIIRRYKETRHTHPLTRQGYALPEAVKMERMALERLLQEALAQLTETQRRRLLASVLNDESNQRIAALESVDESAVRRSIQRGLASLKKILKKF